MPNLEVPIDLAPQSPISQSNSGNSLNRFTDLPPELLSLIFDALCPKWNRSPANLFIVQYRRELQAFAELRLLSKAISLLITPALYEEIVIWLGAPARMERLGTLFATGFQYIRSFLIYSGDFNSSWYNEQIRDGLRLCSGIRNLECYGRHYLFVNRRSPSQTNLSHLTSLTRLVLVQHTSTQLSNALFE
ncbi:hypothetical protein Hypma_000587 [Hypsizygus marmoreus]|uniref:F-box domain-containing protein n=1 Tax=Hypsizygus marmoreus TaxID=39966 RepID=A0A369JHB1_HYPMA|nr:hypothetical protein Hypma_000587 [Hypsizygus marmoreus]